ncbi:MAG TPA: cation:proton antiporter [Candidatus Polarisedimenticolia bacterium]|nr:cation:proton antiporter [Candidatus Polarisedimenticolia bacterium]
MSNADLVIKLFLQLAVILSVCHVVALAGRRVGQTRVVCEMVAGVLLGPSLLGLLVPGVQEWLFPLTATVGEGAAAVVITHPSMSILYAISQVGLVLYMFLVGLEFNTGLIAGRMRSAGLVSAAGIVIPFALGAAYSTQLTGGGRFFHPEVTPPWAALYLGACMSITAFPMLARIIYEKGIAGTRLGTLTLAAGSMDDAVAWCLLAVVLAFLKGSVAIAVLAIGGGALFTLAMIVAGRPLLRGFERRVERDDGLTVNTLVFVLLVLSLAAWFTDAIGIYAVFGAFIVGAVMPRGRFAREVRGHTEYLTTGLLLPVFFVYSGLNTRLGLVSSVGLWGVTAAIILLAIAGKGLACAAAARAGGESWRDAATIGTLMNARGLMELIILNIGLQAGIITPTLFTILVMMAIVTTLMASPLFQLLYGRHLEQNGAEERAGSAAAV